MAEDCLNCDCSSYSCNGNPVPRRTFFRHQHEDDLLLLQNNDFDPKHIMSFMANTSDPRNKPVFESSSMASTSSQIQFVLKLLSIKSKHPGFTQTCFSEVLVLIKSLLQESKLDVNLPSTYQESYRMVKDILPNYEVHDACLNGCVLFRGELSEAQVCPQCGQKRMDENGKPCRKYYYLPLIPRLQQMFSVEKLASLFQSHDSQNDDTMRDIWDSPVWKEQYGTNGPFKGDKRSISLGYSTDGVQPFTHLNIPYSIWPQLFKIYNLPPTMRDKMDLLMLVGIIPGPKAPHDMNGFHELLVEELLQLSQGVQVWDAFQKENFKLIVDVLVYSMDWPARCKCFKYKSATSLNACPYCKIRGQRISTLDKTIFLDSSVCESEPQPSCVSEERLHDIHYGRALSDLHCQIAEKKRSRKTGVRLLQQTRKKLEARTGKSGEEIFTRLKSYSENHKSRIHIDWMHTAKNVAKIVIQCLSGKSDSDKVRMTEVSLGRLPVENVDEDDHDDNTVCVGLRRKRAANNDKRKKKKRLPPAPFLLDAEGLKVADNRVKRISVPINYSYRPRQLFENAIGMKSSEWIKVLTDGILIYAVRGLIGKDQFGAVQKLSSVFKVMGAPTVKKEEINTLKEDVADACNLMEHHFPISIQTLMFHLPHHLPNQMAEYGPLGTHSMFAIERFMSFITQRMTNHRFPEVTALNLWRLNYVSTLLDLTDCTKRDPNLQPKETNTPKYLKGDRGKLLTIIYNKRQSFFLKDLLREDIQFPAQGRKYFAASWRNKHTGRLQEYRCEQVEERTSTVSSVVAVKRGGKVFIGRIQYFLLYHHKSVSEIAFVNWFGEATSDPETDLWLCRREENYPMNPFCNLDDLSPPLVHVWEGNTLWLLNL